MHLHEAEREVYEDILIYCKVSLCEVPTSAVYVCDAQDYQVYATAHSMRARAHTQPSRVMNDLQRMAKNELFVNSDRHARGVVDLIYPNFYFLVALLNKVSTGNSSSQYWPTHYLSAARFLNIPLLLRCMREE